jgi:hypothetical protein
MKLKLLGAAFVTLITCAPASAATIVQTRPDESQPFDLFDPALGTLDAVTVQFSFPSVVRIVADVFANTAGPLTLDSDLSVPFTGFYAVSNEVRGSQSFGSAPRSKAASRFH